MASAVKSTAERPKEKGNESSMSRRSSAASLFGAASIGAFDASMATARPPADLLELQRIAREAPKPAQEPAASPPPAEGPKDPGAAGTPVRIPDMTLESDTGCGHGGGCDCGGRQAASFNVVPKLGPQHSVGRGDVSPASAWGRDTVNIGLHPRERVSRGGVPVPGEASGYCEPTFGLANVQYVRIGSEILVSGLYTVDVHWDTKAFRIDVPNADAPSVTRDTYQHIIGELSPSAGGYVDTRVNYWCSPLTERHERFHAKDYIEDSRVGSEEAKKRLEAVKIPESIAKDEEKLRAKMDKLLAGYVEDIRSYVKQRYDAGGEARAYGDGEAGYRALVRAVLKRAQKEGWAPPPRGESD